MDLFQAHRKYYEYREDGEVIAIIDRTFKHDIAVKLLDGYHQRFWPDWSDQRCVQEIKKMQKEGIPSL